MRPVVARSITLRGLAVGPALALLVGASPPPDDAPAEVQSRRLKPRPEEPAEPRKTRIDGVRATYSGPSAGWPKPEVDPSVRWDELGPIPTPTKPTGPAEKATIDLGRRLFFDPRVSGSGQIACASCHDPDLGWADGRTTSFGHGRKALARNAPGLLNAGMARSLFWDGRAASLEDQARAVILNPAEMNAPSRATVGAIAAVPEYRPLFAAAFGSDAVSLDAIARALAAFERTIVGGRSRFDAFLKGNPKELTDEAVAGLDLFRGRGRCLNCHHGPAFSDGMFHDLGLSYHGRAFEDLGRYRVTGEAGDVGRSRTPSLRDVTSTRPYMHNGLFELDGIPRMYNAGMVTHRPKEGQPGPGEPPFPAKSPLLRPLDLNDRDLADLRAFLESLAEPRTVVRPPTLPGIDPKKPDRGVIPGRWKPRRKRGLAPAVLRPVPVPVFAGRDGQWRAGKWGLAPAGVPPEPVPISLDRRIFKSSLAGDASTSVKRHAIFTPIHPAARSRQAAPPAR